MGLFSKKKYIHKDTWQHDSRDARSMIDHIVLDKRLAKDILDVTVKRGVGSGISNHFLVLTKVKMKEKRKTRHRGKTGKKVINVGKLRKKEVAREYEDRMKKWEEYKGSEIGDVERE